MGHRDTVSEVRPVVGLDSEPAASDCGASDYGRHAAAQRALGADESRFGLMFERTADALMLLDGTTGLFVDCNRATTEMLRCADKQELLALHPSQISPPCQLDGRPSSEKADEMIAAALRNGSHRFEWTYCSAQRENFPVEVLLTPIIVDEQQLILCTLRDITERKQAEAALNASESRFRLMFERTADALLLLDGTTGLFVECNQAAAELLRCQDKKELLQLHPSQISPMRQPDGRLSSEKADEMIATALRNGSHRFEWVHCSVRRADFHAEVLLTPIRIDEQNLLIATVRDITRKKESEELIWKQANFDTLTGLPNRRMLHDRLQHAIRKADRSGLPMALLFVDLDRFKEVNDTLGHHMGDVLLADAAERLGSCVRDGDTVARLGGDEFTVILSDLADVAIIERVAQDILRKLADPFALRDEVAYVSASIGVTLYPDDATSVEDMLKHADQAMYAAKNQGRNRCCYFTASMQEIAQERMRLIGDLRVALNEHQLRVHFQPIIELASGRIVKAEALLRWQHPHRGLVAPTEFIALAEESGIIHEIGDWVFRESAGWAKRWRNARNGPFQVAINMSPVQFNKGANDHEPWLAHLRRLGIHGESIVVEITEGQLAHGNATLDKTLLRFREAGIQVVVDDFGTGSSSLAYVKKFGIDYLKIDQSFIRNLVPASSDLILSEAIIVMAHTLGMKVIAEGVETTEQHALLVAAGCDLAQGFLYAKPMPPEEFETVLDAQSP